MHNFPVNSHIKDIDILYWDENDLTRQSEMEYEKNCAAQLHDIGFSVDVKNIARVHLWYEQKLGIVKNPYLSIEPRIRSWTAFRLVLPVRLA